MSIRPRPCAGGIIAAVTLAGWAVSSLFIGDSNGTHQSEFDEYARTARREVRAPLGFAWLFQVSEASTLARREPRTHSIDNLPGIPTIVSTEQGSGENENIPRKVRP